MSQELCQLAQALPSQATACNGHALRCHVAKKEYDFNAAFDDFEVSGDAVR